MLHFEDKYAWQSWIKQFLHDVLPLNSIPLGVCIPSSPKLQGPQFHMSLETCGTGDPNTTSDMQPIHGAPCRTLVTWTYSNLKTLQLLSLARLPQTESGSQDQYHAGCSSTCINISHQCLLTSGVSKVPSSFPAVWASVGVFLMFIQAGFAVDPPKACHLVWDGRYEKADLTHQFVWRWIHKLAVITMSIGSHLSHLSENIMYISYFCHNPNESKLHGFNIMTAFMFHWCW